MQTLIITTMARMIVTETMKMIRMMMVNGTLLYWCNKKLDMISC
jgi:hypothetical protein